MHVVYSLFYWSVIFITTFALRLLAMFTMTIDHIGYVLFPGQMLFRIIGRLAFPIYCFLVAEGCVHTRNENKYIARMVLFALISEIPFDWMCAHRAFNTYSQNVFFTLTFGLMAIVLFRNLGGIKKWYISLVPAVFFGVVAQLLNTDYGWYGVALIVLFYVLRNTLSSVPAFMALQFAYAYFKGNDIYYYTLFAAAPILLYNGAPGPKKLQWLFYGYYPLHMVILCVLRLLL